jgi:hypothetical protein
MERSAGFRGTSGVKDVGEAEAAAAGVARAANGGMGCIMAQILGKSILII